MGLADNYLNQAGYGLRPIDEGYRLAREAVEKALAIDPTMRWPTHLLGWIAMYYDGDPAAAARTSSTRWRSSRPTSTSSAAPPRWLTCLGRLDRPCALDDTRTRRDPVNADGLSDLGFYLPLRRPPGRGDRELPHRAQPEPGRWQSRTSSIGVALLLKGDAAAALAEIAEGNAAKSGA